MVLKGLSLFSGAGIGELFLKKCDISIVVANEIVRRRADLYSRVYPECKMVCGDICDKKIFDEIVKIAISEKVEFMIASPPCQGMSVAGKNRYQDDMVKDERNYLINHVVGAIEEIQPKYVLIENVPMLLKLKLRFNNQVMSIMDVLKNKFGCTYDIDGSVLNAVDYGVPQNRNRAIIRMWVKGAKWEAPKKASKKVTVREAIGYLPSLEAGERSSVKWHFARKHDKNHILWMRHTATGETAFSNKVYFPHKDDGSRIKGYNTTYRRIEWDKPAPTITIRNDAISSQKNVHPGRKLKNGLYSDARVLTPLELMILNSIPLDWNIPEDTPEILIRQVIGESIPPLMIKKIVQGINV